MDCSIDPTTAIAVGAAYYAGTKTLNQSISQNDGSNDQSKLLDLNVRMGYQKTSHSSEEYFVAEIQPGKMLYEMDGVSEDLAREAFRLAAAKLPIATVFATRHLGS